MPSPLAAAYNRDLERMRTRIITRMSATAAAYVRRQGREAAAAYRAHLDPVEAISPADVRLLQALTPQYRAIARGVTSRARQRYGFAAQARLEPILEEAGARIVTVQGTARNVVREQLRIALRQQLTNAQTERLIKDVVGQTYRAERIARTETAMASNDASMDIYRQEGIDQIEVMDSPDCGVHTHDDPEKADGMILTIGQAATFPNISHPNCVRAFAPVV